MKMAQHQLLESRSATTELFSNALNQHADNFEQILADSQRIKKSHVQNLRVSAKAFQKHENQESQLIQRFEKASDQLLDQVQACIEQ